MLQFQAGPVRHRLFRQQAKPAHRAVEHPAAAGGPLLPFTERYLDGVAVLPSNWLEWKESLEYGMSIALAFGAGNMLAYLLFEVLPRAFTSSGKPSAAAYWIARAWGQHAGKEALRRRARLLQDILRTAGPIIGFVATVSGSIYTGLKGFLLN